MAAIDNLNKAITDLQAELVVVQNAIATLKAGSTNDAAVQSAADSVAAVTASLDSAIK